MSSVSEPQIIPTDESLTCNLPTGHPTTGDPPYNQSMPACTPIHSNYHTTGCYGIDDFAKESVLNTLVANIAPYILGPMPPDAFLDQFLPSCSTSIPEGTPSFQEGMFTSLLPPTNVTGVTGAAGGMGAKGATGVSGATLYTAIVRPLANGPNTFFANLFI